MYRPLTVLLVVRQMYDCTCVGRRSCLARLASLVCCLLSSAWLFIARGAVSCAGMQRVAAQSCRCQLTVCEGGAARVRVVRRDVCHARGGVAVWPRRRRRAPVCGGEGCRGHRSAMLSLVGERPDAVTRAGACVTRVWCERWACK
jgi:hypothetical protein